MAATSPGTSSDFSVIIFDLGRVLTHIDFDAFPNALGLRTDEERRPYRNDASHASDLYEKGKLTTEEFIQRLYEIFQRRFSPDHLRRAWDEIICDQNVEILPTVRAVLETHAAAVLSNTCSTHWEKALATTPILHHIPRYYLSFQLGVKKPAPEIYIHVIRDLAVPPRRILFIDDLPENVAGAEAAGIRGIVFRNTSQLRFDLQKLKIL